MSSAGRIVVAGAGIGGLTAALALAQRGFAVTVAEAAPRLQELGAGVQLSPNASRILMGLGLAQRLEPHAVVPTALRVMHARSGRPIVSAPLGDAAATRYGAPFWTVHRGDLQRALVEAVGAEPRIDLHLGLRVKDFALRERRVVIVGRGANATIQLDGVALIGADGARSTIRERLGLGGDPRFTGQVAWRALVPAADMAAPFRAPMTHLWLGPRAHVVHYPVRAGAAINIVAIVRQAPTRKDGETPGDPALLLAKLAGWAAELRDLVAAAADWTVWPLYDAAPLPHWGAGPVTLLGDAGHAMRPFLAQGAAMAIEDAAALARRFAERPADAPEALRAYEQARRTRTARVQLESARNGRRYAMRGPLAYVRDRVLARGGGEGLLRRYDWLYDWRDEP